MRKRTLANLSDWPSQKIVNFGGRVGEQARPKPDFLSPRRTGREVSLIRLSQKRSTEGMHRQLRGVPGSEKLQAQSLEVGIIADPFRRRPAQSTRTPYRNAF